MPVFFRWYRNSFLATLVSIMGTVCVASGGTILIQGVIAGGLGLVAAGFLLFWLADGISRRKAEKQAEKRAARCIPAGVSRADSQANSSPDVSDAAARKAGSVADSSDASSGETRVKSN